MKPASKQKAEGNKKQGLPIQENNYSPNAAGSCNSWEQGCPLPSGEEVA